MPHPRLADRAALVIDPATVAEVQFSIVIVSPLYVPRLKRYPVGPAFWRAFALTMSCGKVAQRPACNTVSEAELAAGILRAVSVASL